jgi:signal transduction histidine kinase
MVIQLPNRPIRRRSNHHIAGQRCAVSSLADRNSGGMGLQPSPDAVVIQLPGAELPDPGSGVASSDVVRSNNDLSEIHPESPPAIEDHEDWQDAAVVATVLSGVGAILTGTGAFASRLRQSLRYLARWLALSEAELWLYNRPADELQLQASFVRSDRRFLTTRRGLGMDALQLGQLGRQIEPTTGALAVPRSTLRHRATAPPEFHWAVYPLRVDRRLLGVLLLWRDGPWSEAARPAIDGVSRLLALAIDGDRAKRAEQALPAVRLQPWLEKIRSSLDLDAILAAAVRELQSVLKVDRCAYWWALQDAGGGTTLAVSHQASRHPETDEGFAGAVMEGAEWLLVREPVPNPQGSPWQIAPLRYNDLSRSPDHRLADWAARAQVGALVVMPVRTPSGHVGAIACTTVGQRAWSPADCDALRWAADRLAVAIDQAELYDRSQAAVRATETQFRELERTLNDLKQAQAQLVQSEKMSSLGQLAAGIAHEINNPVNFVSGNLEWASTCIQDLIELVRLYQTLEQSDRPDIAAFRERIDLDFMLEDLPQVLNSMRLGTDRIQGIVTSMRNFSRLDRAEVASIDLHEGIDSTLVILHSRLERKHHPPKIDVVRRYGDLPPVECHAGQLNQVFMNLLSNAIDALDNHEGQPCIDITTQPITLDNGCAGVEIAIADNGEGIAPDIASRVFDPFFTTKPVGKGTGLGLSISYQIVVDRHGGQIHCEARPEGGTVFWVRLPVTLLG